MAGTKRTHETMNGKPNTNTNTNMLKADDQMTPTPSAPLDPSSQSRYIPMFEHFRAELDEHHDRRERVMKASKDITANSKKIIFALQRVKTLGQPLSDKRIQTDISRLYSAITALLTSVAPDLTSLNTYRYYRNISGGLQEYMEAVLFQHYLEQQRLMTYEEAQASVPAGVLLTYEDYVLGVFDVTGEMMRFAITSLATTGKVPEGSGGGKGSILSDLQGLRAELEALDVSGSYALGRDFESKLKVTRQSVEKVESGVYGVIVRGKERPPGWMPDVSERREDQETY